MKQDLTHISVYSLIVEDGTKLKKLLETGKLKPIDDEIERYMYWYVKRRLEQNGYMHYEISNFAKPGYQCKHNLDCWSQKEYLGFGVNASSFENSTRFSNTESMATYMKNISIGDIFKNIKVEEKMNEQDLMNEYMILGLRKIKGININEFRQKFQKSLLNVYRDKLMKLLKEDLITIDINDVKLSKKRTRPCKYSMGRIHIERNNYGKSTFNWWKFNNE